MLTLHRRHKKDAKNFYKMGQAYPELRDIEESMALLVKLGVQFNDDELIDELAAKLKQKSDEIEYRWKQRVAFLGGNRRPDCDHHAFFRGCSQKDLCKKILEIAGLGPKRFI